ncbi:hypothetical protein P7C70_g3951, partial [Phenoliferia sp. Uapishka_3]
MEVAHSKLESDAAKVKDALVTECRRIKAEEPVRENKKLKKQSQKQWREKTYTHFNNAIGALARQHGVLSGKWLFMPGPDTVDSTWSKIVHSLSSSTGALYKAGGGAWCQTAKVSSDLGDSKTYVICVYVTDSWNKEAVEGVLRILVKDLGLRPTSYKCDANTIIGIDSKHESGIPSSLYKISDFMTKEELDELKKEKQEAFEKNGQAVPKKKTEEEINDFEAYQSSDEEKEPVKKKGGRKPTLSSTAPSVASHGSTASYLENGSSWLSIVHSISSSSGALNKAGGGAWCQSAKVSSQVGDLGNFVICVYVGDSWSREAVGGVLRVLVEGLNLPPENYKIRSFQITSDAALFSKDFIPEEEANALRKSRQDAFDKNGQAVPKKKIEEEINDFIDFESSDEEQEPVGTSLRKA